MKFHDNEDFHLTYPRGFRSLLKRIDEKMERQSPFYAYRRLKVSDDEAEATVILTAVVSLAKELDIDISELHPENLEKKTRIESERTKREGVRIDPFDPVYTCQGCGKRVGAVEVFVKFNPETRKETFYHMAKNKKCGPIFKKTILP